MNSEKAEKKPTVLGGCLLAFIIVCVCAIGYGAIFGDDDPPPGDLTQYRDEITRLAAICDTAQVAVGEAMQNLSTVGAMNLARAARTMEDNCTISWLGIKELETPEGLNDKQRAAVRSVDTECRLAFYSRAQLAKALLPILDGDARPSMMIEFEDEIDFANRQTAACATAMKPILDLAATK